MFEVETGLLPALDRLRVRWRVMAVACSVSVTLAICVSLALTKEYTAVSRIVIEPPAGSDARASMGVSPIYFESLRSYEIFAASDNLFLQAVDRFGLRRDSAPIDKLKKSVLKAELPRNTRILEIRATLPDPKTAHAFALYIAEETVKLNQELIRQGDQELTAEAEKHLADARLRVQNIEKSWGEAIRQGPVAQLTAEIEADEALRSMLQRDAAQSEVLFESDDPRTERYRRQFESLRATIAAKRKLLAERLARMEELSFERSASQTGLKTAESRLQERRSALGFRGERLRIIDPGIVPERPSFPNIALNAGMALFAAAVLSALYLALELSYTVQRAEYHRRSIGR